MSTAANPYHFEFGKLLDLELFDVLCRRLRRSTLLGADSETVISVLTLARDIVVAESHLTDAHESSELRHRDTRRLVSGESVRALLRDAERLGVRSESHCAVDAFAKHLLKQPDGHVRLDLHLRHLHDLFPTTFLTSFEAFWNRVMLRDLPLADVERCYDDLSIRTAIDSQAFQTLEDLRRFQAAQTALKPSSRRL